MISAFDLKQKAEWRREKAQHYSEDPRNRKAADLLETFAAEAEAGNHNQFVVDRLTQIQMAVESDCDDLDGSKAKRFREEKSELLNEVGFHFFPADLRALHFEFLKRVGEITA